MIRVFPRKTNWTPTDKLAFVGIPPHPLFMPPAQPVRISVAFTWDIPGAEMLEVEWKRYYKDVQVGGPAYGDAGGEFVPGRFVKEGVTITSRGCAKSCPWCFVPKREGKVRELEIKDGWIVQDNNLLACSRPHIEAVFSMLRRQKKGAIFSGGLDATLFQDWHRELIDSIKIKELWFACDSVAGIPILDRAARILDGISIRRRRCYVMIGYKNETLLDAEKRLEDVLSLGFMPFSQLHQGAEKKKYSRDWMALNKKWSRPAAYMPKKGATK